MAAGEGLYLRKEVEEDLYLQWEAEGEVEVEEVAEDGYL